MFIAAVVASVLLALVLLASAVLWLRQAPPVLETAEKLSIPLRLLPLFAVVKTLGAIGVLVGLWVEWLGVAAATGVVVYFVLAVGAHLRARDYHGVKDPVVPLVLAAAVLVLRVATL